MTKDDVDKSLHVESQGQIGRRIDELHCSIRNRFVMICFPLYDGLAKWLLGQLSSTTLVVPDGPFLQMILDNACSREQLAIDAKPLEMGCIHGLEWLTLLCSTHCAGVVHAYVDQKLVKSNKITSFN